ncbi:MAG: hypothetical protein AB1659_06915, partial [Thermodesulfobacteriota bacterium]
MNVESRLEAALTRRELLFSITDAFRLVNGKGDGMEGLILEKYGRHFLSQIFNPEWIEYKTLLTSFIRRQFNGVYFIVKDRSRSGAAGPDAFKSFYWIQDSPSRTT